MKSTIRLAVGSNGEPVIKIKHVKDSDDMRDDFLGIFLGKLKQVDRKHDNPASYWLKIVNTKRNVDDDEYEVTAIAAMKEIDLLSEARGMMKEGSKSFAFNGGNHNCSVSVADMEIDISDDETICFKMGDRYMKVSARWLFNQEHLWITKATVNIAANEQAIVGSDNSVDQNTERFKELLIEWLQALIRNGDQFKGKTYLEAIEDTLAWVADSL